MLSSETPNQKRPDIVFQFKYGQNGHFNKSEDQNGENHLRPGEVAPLLSEICICKRSLKYFDAVKSPLKLKALLCFMIQSEPVLDIMYIMQKGILFIGISQIAHYTFQTVKCCIVSCFSFPHLLWLLILQK